MNYQTKYPSKKKFRPPEEIVQSLIHLRDEMYDKKDANTSEIFFKINSCLYKGYSDD